MLKSGMNTLKRWLGLTPRSPEPKVPDLVPDPAPPEAVEAVEVLANKIAYSPPAVTLPIYRDIRPPPTNPTPLPSTGTCTVCGEQVDDGSDFVCLYIFPDRDVAYTICLEHDPDEVFDNLPGDIHIYHMIWSPKGQKRAHIASPSNRDDAYDMFTRWFIEHLTTITTPAE